MERVLLDTNIYGLLVMDISRILIEEKLNNHPNILIYGNIVIRKELRDTPKRIKQDGKNLRIQLLLLYDVLIKNHILEMNAEILNLAKEYFWAYKKSKGNFSWHELEHDFLIIACATINNLNIVVSEDRRTMLSERSMEIYDVINHSRELKTPRLISYEEFKRMLK